MTDRGVDTSAALRLGLITGLGGLVAALVAVPVAVSTSSATTGILTRAVLITALLVLAPRLAPVTRGAVLPSALAGLLLGHLLTLGWFAGQAYVWRLTTDSTLLSAGLDLLTWLSVGGIATRLVSHRQVRGDRYP